jgi:hypothetical protein
MVDGKLQFHGPGPGFYERLQAAAFDQAVREGRGYRVYWNGSRRGNAMCRLGEARS